MAKQPLHERIERELRRRIDAMADGERLPSEPRLAEEFAVSRMTVRAALGAIERDGLLHRMPGRGSFARKAPTTRRVAQLVSFHDQAQAAGKTARSRVLGAERRVPTLEEATALGGPASVVAITRVRCLDDLPVAIEHAVFVPELATLLDLDLETASAHSAIRRLGYEPVAGSSTLGARNAGEDATALAVSPETALLVETRIVRGADGSPLEYTSSAYVPQRYSLDVEFTIAHGAPPQPGSQQIPPTGCSQLR